MNEAIGRTARRDIPAGDCVLPADLK